MKDDDKRPRIGTGSFFHTLVLVGGSIAIGCGGAATTDDDNQGDGDGDDSGSGGALSGTGGAGTGGTGTGGMVSGAGGTAAGTGGSASLDDYPCAPSQIECPPESLVCAYTEDYAYVLPGDCQCNFDRPAGQEDCDETEALICILAQAEPQEVAGEVFGITCDCIPAPEDCFSACSTYPDSPSFAPSCSPDLPGVDGWEPILCGCELPILR